MCETLKIIYSCGHHERRRTKCSKFTRRKSSLRNKLFGYYNDRRDCGSVRRDRSRVPRNCDSCTARIEGLASARAGDGANPSRRPRADRTPPPRRTRQETSRPAGHRRREATPSRSRSRMPSPAYERPPQPADQPRYGETRAPPPSPARPPRLDERRIRQEARSPGKSAHRRAARKPSREAIKSRARKRQVTRKSPGPQDDGPGVLSVSASRKPAFDRASAFVPPWQQTAAAPAPAPRRGSLPSQQHPARSRQPSHDMPPWPDVRRMRSTGSQQHAPPPRPPERQARPPPPKPFYEVYLDAQKEAERAQASRRPSAPPRPPPPAQQPLHPVSSSTSKPSHRSSSQSTEKKKKVDSGLRWLPFRFGADPPKDTDSAISFVCNHAREIERQGPDSMQ